MVFAALSLLFNIRVRNELGVDEGVLPLVGVHAAEDAAGEDQAERHGDPNEDVGVLLNQFRAGESAHLGRSIRGFDLGLGGGVVGSFDFGY